MTPPPDADFWYDRDVEAYGVSTAGQHVTESTALQISAVFRAVVLIARSLAALPIRTFRTLPDREVEGVAGLSRMVPGGKERLRGDLHYVLNVAPHPRWTPFTYREQKFTDLLLGGNHYSRIVAGSRGFVSALQPLTRSRVRPVVLDSGRWLYLYRDRNGEEVRFTQDDIHHVRGFNPDPEDPCGLSPVGLARRSLGLTMATEDFGARQFSQSPKPAVALEIPGDLDDEEEFSREWRRRYSGQSGWNGVAILKNGMKLQPIPGMTHDDAQFLQTRVFQLAEVARWYGTPLHKLSELSRATFSNIEEQNIDWVVDGLLPWGVLDEQHVRRDLVLEGDDTECEYVFEGLLRGNSLQRAQYYQILSNIRAMTANEIRALEGRDPVPWGDEAPQVQGAAPSAPSASDPPPEPPPRRGAFEDDAEDEDDPMAQLTAQHPADRIAAMYRRSPAGSNGRTHR